MKNLTTRETVVDRLETITNRIADSILEMGTQEILAEERESGNEPMQESVYVRGVLRKHQTAMFTPIARTETSDLQSAPVGIVIADDHPIFRDGLRRLLEAERGLKVIGEASDGIEAVRLTRQLQPDVLLLDLAMPRQTGLEALRDLVLGSVTNGVRVLLLTAAVEKHEIVEALQLGARGVVLKDAATELLLKSIHSVMRGEYWVGRESVSNLVQYLRTLVKSSGEETRRKNFGLTHRELEVVSTVVAGYSNKEIAAHYKISEDTVKHHLSNTFDKLGVSTRLELALFAVNQCLPLKGIS